MKSFWSEPFLWIHAAGLAAVPLFLGVCLLGLASAVPQLPVWLELLLVAAPGISLVVAMQLLRPFNIFNVLIVSVRPQMLSTNQRRLLRLFKQPSQRPLVVLVPIVLVAILWQLYQWAPAASSVLPEPPGGRAGGLVVATLAFAASNLFFQVPVAVLRVLLTGESEFAAAEPYPVEQIHQDFTSVGLRVNRILPLETKEFADG